MQIFKDSSRHPLPPFSQPDCRLRKPSCWQLAPSCFLLGSTEKHWKTTGKLWKGGYSVRKSGHIWHLPWDHHVRRFWRFQWFFFRRKHVVNCAQHRQPQQHAGVRRPTYCYISEGWWNQCTKRGQVNWQLVAVNPQKHRAVHAAPASTRNISWPSQCWRNIMKPASGPTISKFSGQSITIYCRLYMVLSENDGFQHVSTNPVVSQKCPW